MSSVSPRPILVSIPHASSAVPKEVAGLIALSADELMEYSDWYTDEIFNVDNVYKVQSNFSRVIVDPNRAPDDISKEYEQAAEGVIVHTTWDGKSVYAQEPDQEIVDALIKNYHNPYHDALEQHIPKVQFLIDCHSFMPYGPKLKKDSGQERPDINLGNLNYSSCSREHTIFFRDFFESKDFKVSINFPYAGKYILGHHCHRRRIPPFLVPGIQIEINQGLYVKPNQNYEKIPGKIEEFNALFEELIEAFMLRFCPDEVDTDS